LSNNDKAYNSYFEWKKHVIFDDKTVALSPLCDMCIQLHLEDYYYLTDNKFIKDKNLVDHVCYIPIPNNKKFFNLKQSNFLNKVIDLIMYLL
jgi:hypothetical protein